MQFKQKNIATMLVAKAVAATADLESKNIQAVKSSIAVGEPVVVSMGGVVVDATGTLPTEFRVGVKLTDGDMKFSDTINSKMVKKVTVQSYVAGANQVDYIGYNGTSGAIDVIDDNVYKINMYIIGTDALDFSRMTVKHGVYKSDSNATQGEIAAGLTQSLISNFSREGMKLKYGTDIIKFERVNSGTSLNTSSGTIAVTKGSKYVTILNSGDNKAGWYNTDGAILVAGDVIRFTAAAAGGVGACYVVSEIVSGGSATTMVLKLDAPYQGATNTAIAATSVSVIASASIGNWGIKFTGTEYPYSAFKLGYGRSAWRMGLDDFGSTTITNSVAMSLGSGNGKAVNELESWISTNRGNWYLYTPGVTYPVLESSTSSSYALIHFQYTDDYVTELGHGSDAHKELWIACVIGDVGAYKDANTGLGTIIDAYATALKWDIVYNGASGTANVLAIGA